MSKLKKRHIQMIALGGAIGTGLFFGSAKSIHMTGPSIIAGYLIGGIVTYIIMRALGEMVVHEPNPGAFSYYSYKYVGDYLGFVSGWYAWFEYTIVCMLETTAATIFLDYWFLGVPHWITAAIILLFFVTINITNVGLFGEFEFWFAGIKVTVIILMILFAIYLMCFNGAIHASVATNLSSNIEGNFFANGLTGFLFSLVMVVFSFGGTQFVGIAAADSEDPDKNIPKAINGVIFRIIIFYLGTMTVIILLYPWQKLNTDISPFVDVFGKIGLPNAAQIMNVVAITAALSALNSCLYAAARMMYNLAGQRNAPAYLYKTNKRNIPINAVLSTSVIIALTIIINYLFPDKAIMYLIAIATTSIIVTWSTINICHVFFKKKTGGYKLYPLPFYPYTNIIASIFLFGVIVIMLFMPEMRVAVFVMIGWIAILSVAFYIKKAYQKKQSLRESSI